MTDSKAHKTIFLLSIFTVVYNLAEGFVSAWLGFEDDALALFGFGADSFAEMISGVGVMMMTLRIWNNPESGRSKFEKTALQITGYCFYLLVIGLVFSSGAAIFVGEKPTSTFWGIVISSVSIIIMTWLLWAKKRAGVRLQSKAVLADANCTKVCIYMSLVLLASSAVYELFHFQYADALGALGLAYLSYKEGKECFEAVKGNHCDCC
ncbi:MAG: hypothetical protein CRN43_05415 [Candidatus Nephrothrix sp. EaCA]|nr:MAG: hypothetical protein CRN43_05415 [Candidatus Nephrothrix sp. EaCA]